MKKWGKFLLIPLLTAIALVAVFWPSPTPKATEVVKESVYSQEPVKTPEKEPEKPATVEELYALVNAERAKAGVKPLVLDPLLNKSAQLKAVDMLAHNYRSHVNPITGKRGYSYITDVGATCIYGSENFYTQWGTTPSEDALDGWLDSPAHKQAILDPKYESTGFGVAPGEFTYIVQHFCDKG